MLLGTLTMIYILFLLGDGFKFDPDFLINKTFLAVLVLLYPLTDLLRVFALRIKDGKSPFIADQNHIHHFLLKKFKIQSITTAVILTLELFLVVAILSM